jgi:hypothetical protein
MKLAKSLLLGSATAFVAVAGANAADLPSKKAAPATYVKVCDAYGAGFYTIPGTDTCIKVGGRVRADYTYSRAQDSYTKSATSVASVTGGQALWGNEVRGRIDMDARTPTAYGTVQAVFSTRIHRTSGVLAATGLDSKAGTAAPQLEAGYVRFAGFTFGVAKDNFAFMPSTFYGTGHWAAFANGAFQVAYTAVLGGGVSATLALQDYGYTGAGGVAQVAAVQDSGKTVTITDASGTGWSEALQNSYNRMPQINGRVDWDQSWGTLSVMGATANVQMNTSAKATTYNKSKQVYAVGAGLKLNLPMLAAGDVLWLNAGYADGMTEYTTNWTSFKSSDTSRNVGGMVSNHPSFGAGANGIETFKSWNVAALLTHFWAPQWRNSFVATYGSINAPATANAAAWGTAAGGYADAKVWNVGSQLTFLPTKDFEIGVDVLYARVINSNSATAAANVSQGNWTGRMRVERTF